MESFSLKARFASVRCCKGSLQKLTSCCGSEVSSPSDFYHLPCVKEAAVLLLLQTKKILLCADKSGCSKMHSVALLVFCHGPPFVEALT